MSSLNIPHLRKIQVHILDVPDRLNMSDWWVDYKPVGADNYDSFSDVDGQVIPTCGTAGCIAGWSWALRGAPNYFIARTEMEFLGLPNDALFFPSQWPVDLYTRYNQSTTVVEKSEIAAEAIDLIIKGDGTFFPVAR